MLFVVVKNITKITKYLFVYIIRKFFVYNSTIKIGNIFDFSYFVLNTLLFKTAELQIWRNAKQLFVIQVKL